jgi:hypothetical protein
MQVVFNKKSKRTHIIVSVHVMFSYFPSDDFKIFSLISVFQQC